MRTIMGFDKNMLLKGDCLIEMQEIKDKSIDLVLCDLPFGTIARGFRDSKANWDKIINISKLREQYERICKDDSVIVLFGNEPFTSTLICSNLDMYRYSWIWKKDTPTGHLNSKYKPLSYFEDICVFSKSTVGSLSKNPIKYFPQGVIEVNKKKKNNPNSNWRKNKGFNGGNNILNSDKEYIQKYENYPTNILEFSRDKNAVHPSQKPVLLLEYLIKTYTNENDIVLDNTMGSGSTGVACKSINRNFIGIEKDEKYFEIAEKRINGAEIKPNKFKKVEDGGLFLF